MTASLATSARPALSDVFRIPEGANGVLAEQLYGGDFIAAGENVIIFSGVGMGKFHFAKLIATANGKTSYRMNSDIADLTALDIKEPIAYIQGSLRGPSTMHGLRPELVDCDLLILDGLPDPVRLQGFSEQLSKLLKLRAEAGRSTIILVTADSADRNLLAQRFPVTLEGRPWHVLEIL